MNVVVLIIGVIHDGTDNIPIFYTHTHTHLFNGPLSRTTLATRKVKTSLDFTEARDSEWQWHQLGHM